MKLPVRETSRRPAAFTLVELIVVIAIVTLLIAILLPALKNARETAESGRCLTGARQNAIAMMTYAADYNDLLPEYKQLYNDNPFDYDVSIVGYEITRRQTLGAYLNIAEYVSGIGFAPGRTVCPKTNIIYYYNEHLLGSDGHGSPNRWGPGAPGGTIRTADILKPSGVFWAGDYQLNQNEFYGHLGRRNLSFADGHAEAIAETELQDRVWGDVFYLGVKPLTWPY